MCKDIFHPDCKARPWRWEAWTSDKALSQDPTVRTGIAIVGDGYRTCDWIDRRLAA